MNLTLLLLFLLSPAQAAGVEQRAIVQHQEAVVDALAAEVAAARATGASRKELGARMANYRAEAEKLVALEAPLLRSIADDERHRRSTATRALFEALATDRGDEASREVLVSWLGEPLARIEVYQQIDAQTRLTADPRMRSALALDLAEQAGALSLVCQIDAAKARRDAGRAATQAASLRARTAPGQSGGLELVVAAERAEREAARASAAATEAMSLGLSYDALRQAALQLAEGK